MGASQVRNRWMGLAVVALVAVGVLIILTRPAEVTLPEIPGERDPGGTVGEGVAPELSGTDPVYTGRIQGRVLRGGHGIGAAVTLRVFAKFPGSPPRSGRADASGCFAFSGVPPGLHEVSAIGGDGVAVRGRVTVVAGVAPRLIELSLPSGELSLCGRAVHADGRAFSGEVEVCPLEGDVSFFVPTRADGRTTALTLVLDRGMGIAGKVVLRDGTPAAGAWVEWRGDGDGDCRQGSLAAEDGTFYLRGLPGSTLHVLLVRPQKGSGLGPVRIDNWLPRDTEVILPPGLTLSGRVVGSDGRPHEDNDGELWRRTRTGGWHPVGLFEEGGLLERGLPAGPVALVWIPPDHSPYEYPESEPDRLGLPVSWYPAGAKDIVFRLPPR